MYRSRKKYSKKLATMRAAKEQKRLDSPSPDYSVELPELRRIVIIIDFDFGKLVQIIRLYRTNRIDCYKAVVDGEVWKERVGWARVLEGVRKSFIRVHAL